MRVSGRILSLMMCLPLAACLSSRGEAPPPSAPQAPALSGWLAGPAGEALDEADRQRAFDSQIAAVESGRRSSWRSAKGHFGFVEPGPEGSGGGAACRRFTHVMYIDGKAQRGEGAACRGTDGAWRVTG